MLVQDYYNCGATRGYTRTMGSSSAKVVIVYWHKVVAY